MTMIPFWISWASLLLVLFLFAWWRQTRSQNAGWVDVLWATGTGLTIIVAAIKSSGDITLRLIIATMALAWFARLGLHLYQRVKHEAEDARYRHMRQAFHNRQAVFLLFYLAQFIWVLIFSLPAALVVQGEMPPQWALMAAALIYVTCWFGVTLSDRQLAQFRLRPGNSRLTCDVGFWRYSRHPNYFFEWLHWFCYPLLGWNSPFAQLLWLSPAVMFVFLFYFTGIPFTEQQALRKRGDNYRDYQRRTPVFIPWRPKP